MDSSEIPVGFLGMRIVQAVLKQRFFTFAVGRLKEGGFQCF